MTAFTKENILIDREYVHYVPPGNDYDGRDRSKRQFIGRFKQNRVNRGHKAAFIAFLKKNFTVEEYFARMDKGETPHGILESKGYVMPHIKRELRANGLPETPEGLRTLIRNQIEARRAS